VRVNETVQCQLPQPYAFTDVSAQTPVPADTIL